ncbi:TonB-dependent receptor plug domain-containing protein [Parvularcula lutaonensis]|uniref:TonB-dependent receptor plug domain-containing protein n=1 Tax=Parvularcula lutaonensis TaxID=491923 RepID=A0ABV7MAC6_9PROT|nr:TonB-dependent receptor plug domain-containing protein [Parvularcula lutaonensis]GGY36636.1 TonB-dependent receptor [Parvularcula lutaonensis]
MPNAALLSAVALLAFAPMAASAQGDGQSGGFQVFEPEYFERFAPQTASDMLEQVPGFSIRQTGGGRGLGQGGTNVLIDGERVTSKDTNALDILNRTPASAVVRIEITDAATLGVTGLTGQVANVVLDRSTVSGSFEYRAQFRNGARPNLTQGSVSVSGTKGNLAYTLGFENNARRGFEEGPELLLDPNGNLIEERFEHESVRAESPRLTAVIDFDLSEGTSLNVTGSAQSQSFESQERSERSTGEFRRALNGEDEWNADLSTELSRKTGPGTLKLIGYQRFEHSPFSNEALTVSPAGAVSVVSFDQTNDEGETIGRVEYSWAPAEDVSWEIAAETAYNFLDREAVFTVGQGPGAVATPFPDTKVEELRSQGSITRGFVLGEKLSVQASAAAEWSRLTVSGDASNREQDFFRPKGFVSFAYPVSESFDIRARIAREVGQLNFFDFVDSVNLTEDRANAGNAGLVPQQSWDGEIELQKEFGDDEKIIFRLSGSLIEDRVDRVLIETDDGNGNIVLQDAVGNIDEARFASAAVEGTLLTDRWGLTGGRFDFSGERRTSALDDPLTGESRNFSRLAEWNYDINFRQDIPNTPYAWGTGLSDRAEEVLIRFDEVTVFDRTDPWVRAFVEHKDVYGLNLRLWASNLVNTEFTVDRTRYAEFRDGPVQEIERRSRIDNRRFSVTLSGTF